MNFAEILDGSAMRVRRRRELVTAVAVVRDWFLRLPVTVETRSVICRRGFERRGA